MDVASSLGALFAWTAGAALQATVLLLLAWVIDRLLVRRVAPQWLALLWIFALARFFLPPGLSSPLSVTSSLGAPALAAAGRVPESSWLAVGFAVWALGCCACVAARWRAKAQLRARTLRVDPPRALSRALARAARRLGSRAVPAVGILDGLGTPAVFGCRRPTLVLPAGWLEREPPPRAEHALLHELAHLERGDLWLDEACALVRSLLWFHPLVWIAHARIRALGELECDQRVARALGSEARAYRETLILAARDRWLRPAPVTARGFLGQGSALVLRIERLGRSERQGRSAASRVALARAGSVLIALTLAACVLPMAPCAAGLREQARAVLAAAQAGAHPSCFSLHAAALVLADDPTTPRNDP